jgi:membrane protein
VGHGRDGTRPHGWLARARSWARVDMIEVAREVPKRLREHNLTLVAAGVGFYGFLAFVPALIAVVSIYGLIADPTEVEREVRDFAGALPEEVRTFIEFQLRSIANANSAGVSFALVIALAIALWSASGGMAALVAGINIAHERPASGFAKKRGKALLLTLGAIVVLVAVFYAVTIAPATLDDLVGDGFGRTLVGFARWAVVIGVMVLGLGVLYRVATEKRAGWLGLITPGTIVAALGWVIASALFSFYTSNFASYAKTYGSLASVVILLLWLYLSALAVLVGAEFDAASSSATSRLGAVSA